jgi:hypothetical protein
MLRLLTAPPPHLSCTWHSSMRFPASTLPPVQWDQIPAPKSTQGHAGSKLPSQEGNRRTLWCSIPVLFVKVLNLPTNPFPKLAHGAPAPKVTSANLPPTPAPVEVAQWPGWPQYSSMEPRCSSLPVTQLYGLIHFLFGGLFCLLEICFVLLCFMVFSFNVLRFGLVFPFSLKFIYSCFESQSY